jgi:hypothetical protein
LLVTGAYGPSRHLLRELIDDAVGVSDPVSDRLLGIFRGERPNGYTIGNVLAAQFYAAAAAVYPEIPQQILVDAYRCVLQLPTDKVVVPRWLPLISFA